MARAKECGLRQEQQDGVPLVVQQIGHVGRQIQRGLAVVLVGHLHAFRRGRGTGGVHDGTQVGLLARIDALVQLLVRDRGAVGLDLVQATGLDGDDVLRSRALGFGPIRLRLISVFSTTSRRASELLTILRICSAESVS